jgi:hypothetical protein
MSDQGFDEESLLKEASQAAGLDDFGSDDFRAGLRALIATFEQNPMTDRGRRRNRRRLLQLLVTRLKIEAAFRAHPEIRERPLVRPMILTGLPRSGTSALFNLLATDPAARPLRCWEAQCPDPLDGLPPGVPDPRWQFVEDACAKQRERDPEFTKIHYTSADTPEECVLLQSYGFGGAQNGIEVMMEPYGSWFRGQDLRPLYAYYKDLLRMLDWQRPGERWLLKTPAHMWAIDALIETFPDCAVVWSHRDPVVCVASICSMTHTMMAGQVEVDPAVLGPIVMDFYATSLERGLAERQRLEPARFVDVSHDAFVADSMGVIDRIYGHFALPLPPAARAAMADHVQRHPKGEHGEQRYDLAHFGLNAAEVRARFKPYIERFDIAVR